MHTPEVTLLHRIVSGADGAGIDGGLILGRMRTLWATSSALPEAPASASEFLPVTWALGVGMPEGVTESGPELYLPQIRPVNVLCLAVQLHTGEDRVADLTVPWGGTGLQVLPLVRIDSGGPAHEPRDDTPYRWALRLFAPTSLRSYPSDTRVLVFAQHELPVAD